MKPLPRLRAADLERREIFHEIIQSDAAQTVSQPFM